MSVSSYLYSTKVYTGSVCKDLVSAVVKYIILLRSLEYDAGARNAKNL
jgi:hypothetical protein